MTIQANSNFQQPTAKTGQTKDQNSQEITLIGKTQEVEEGEGGLDRRRGLVGVEFSKLCDGMQPGSRFQRPNSSDLSSTANPERTQKPGTRKGLEDS